jgi:hypothetical protein
MMEPAWWEFSGLEDREESSLINNTKTYKAETDVKTTD